MDFGRKSDAKRAMKLHWKEGISLKDAWKVVKSGKKSPKRRKAISPKRRKVQNNAKKAMRMHHREGISLKEAWKRVNKFGLVHKPKAQDKIMGYNMNYDVIGLSFGMLDNCPPGYEKNPKFTVSGRGKQACIKVCPPDQSRNHITNRCNKADVPKKEKALPLGYEINPETGRQRKICGPDEYRDSISKKCKKNKNEPDMMKAMYNTRPLKALPLGYEINPETGRQRKICGPDEYRDPISKKCIKINTAVRGANLRRMPDNPELSMPLLGFGGHNTINSITSNFGKKCKHNSFGKCHSCAAL